MNRCSNEILLARLHSRHAAATPLLYPVSVRRHALDVARLGDCDHHVLFCNQILDVELFGGVDDFGSALVAEALANVGQLVLEDLHLRVVVLENVLQLTDRLLQVLVFLFYLVPLEACKPLQRHGQNRLCLDLAQLETRRQPLPRFVRIGGVPYQLDCGVYVVQGDAQAFEDMGPCLGLGQVEAGAAQNHVVPVLDVVLQHLLEIEDLRAAVDDCQHHHPEGRLQHAVREKLVENDFGLGRPFQLDDDTHAAAPGFVADGGDILDGLVAHQVGHLLKQRRLVDKKRDLGDDDVLASVSPRLDMGACAHLDRTPTCAVRHLHPVHPLG